MKPTMYCLILGLSALAAVVMSVPSYPAVPTAGAVESSVSSPLTSPVVAFDQGRIQVACLKACNDPHPFPDDERGEEDFGADE
jgi:hypothetical protein